MPAEIVTRDELIAAAVRAGVATFSNEQYDTAIKRATDRARQATLNDYTSESFESLTPSTAPDDLHGNVLALSLGELTRYDAGRPQSITDGYNEAAKAMGFIVGGTTHYDKTPGSLLEKHESDDAGVTYQAPDKKFDRKKNDYFGVPRRT